MLSSRKAFTLIELLVVIAIIAILAVVVILTLNPAALLQQSRDANRLSDLSTMADAINVYNTDQSGLASYSLGIASTTYLSVADPSATSTLGTTCSTMGLPTTSTGWVDHCTASSTVHLINGSGWIPINFLNISSGAPFSVIPVDPTNNTSSLYYYTYLTDGATYELTVPLESQKYLKQELIVPDIDPTREIAGNNLTLLPQAEGLVGYWGLDEGGGSTAFDSSGNGNTGAWSGTPTGTSGYYSAGKVGNWAGTFDGVTDYIDAGNGADWQSITNTFTLAGWINRTAASSGMMIDLGYVQNALASAFLSFNGNQISLGINGGGISYGAPPLNQWIYIVGTYNGTTSTVYLNGAVIGSRSITSTINFTPSQHLYINKGAGSLSGLIDDVRVYNRALSAAEITALYNAEH